MELNTKNHAGCRITDTLKGTYQENLIEKCRVREEKKTMAEYIMLHSGNTHFQNFFPYFFLHPNLHEHLLVFCAVVYHIDSFAIKFFYSFSY